MNQFEKNQKIGVETQILLEKTFIPVDTNIATLYGIVRGTIKNLSIAELNLSMSGYAELINPSRKQEIRMDVLGAILNTIGDKPPLFFCQDEVWYSTTLELTQVVLRKWGAMRATLRLEAEQIVNTRNKIITGSPLAKA